MRSLPFLIPFLLFVAACSNDTSRSETPEETIDIEIAEGYSATMRGMMQRTSFPDNSGMLFLFEEEEVRGFWMGNTPLSLDLLFISADSQIVSFTKYAAPFSTEPIPSKAPAQFVLEVPAGFVDLQGIVEGDRIAWRRHDGS